MKVNISVDGTPQELRDFLGWPDVGVVQQQMLEHVSKSMAEGGGGIEPVSLIRLFLAPNAQSTEAMQQAFQLAMQGALGASKASSKKAPKG